MELAQIPVIDLHHFDEKIGDQLVDAVSKWGFAFIRNHDVGFEPEIVDQAFGLSRKFFASPREEKAACSITAQNRGWSSAYTEILDPPHQKVACPS